MKTNLKILLVILILTSCETYRRSKCIKEWVDPQKNIRYSVYKYSYFVRRNDSVFCMIIDTIKTDLNHRETQPQVVKESKKICIDDYGK